MGSLTFRDRVDFHRLNSDGESSSNYRRTIFLAEYEEKTVLVKFCERYGEAAHRTLAAEGLAPKLHFCSLIMGDMFMVVIDLVDGRDAYREFRRRDLPSTVLDDVKLALEKLHDAGLVFGDVRRPNIMVYKSREKGEEEWRGLLVDFDWAGPIGQSKYPAMLNTSIYWADGVAPAVELKKEHDLDMLAKLNLGENL
jgi:RIO-like serine/threonine protein kinase